MAFQSSFSPAIIPFLVTYLDEQPSREKRKYSIDLILAMSKPWRVLKQELQVESDPAGR